jgi:hypothetical protein
MKAGLLVALAIVLVAVGYVETNQNLLGISNSAFAAFAALNTANNQSLPATTSISATATVNSVFTKINNNTSLTTLTSFATASTYTTTTIAAMKLSIEADAAFGGKALPVNPLFPVVKQTATYAGTNSIIAIPQDYITTAAGDNFTGNTPSSYVCYKYNTVSANYAALPYVSANPAATAPTTNSWAFFNYNGGNPTFIAAGTAIAAGTQLMPVVYVLDNGPYDLSATAGTVQDPPIIGAAVGGSSSSSDGDSGCVMNPAAGLSLDWLLMLAAPAMFFLRRRTK